MLSLTHLDKLFWQKEKITKGDLLNYYTCMAPYLLPYLKNRPLVLHRFPNGIHAEHFYQKESGAHLPAFITTASIQHQTKSISYFIIQNVKSLLYVVNLGAIELHSFHARLKNLDAPDYCVFDLDPHKISFNAVVDTALAFHELLQEYEVPHFCKTSGSKGLHIYVPLHGKYDYDIVKKLLSLLAQIIHRQLSSTTSLERLPAKREGKVYIDLLQNQKMQTVVCPYSVRGLPYAPVATPLAWKEVKRGLELTDFNLKTVPKRVAQKADLFAPLLKKGINLTKLLQRLEKAL